MNLFRLLIVAISCVAFLSFLMIQSIAPELVLPHVVSYAIAFLVLWICSIIPYDFWKATWKVLLLATVVILLGTFILGKTSRGSTRWVSVGVTHVQPSQFVKIAMAIVFARILVRKAPKTTKNIAIYIGIASVPTLLVFLQPDLGTSLVLSALAASMLYFGGTPTKYLVGLGMGLVVCSSLIWNVGLREYQKERVYSLLMPENRTSTSSYNAQQAQIAVGSGKMTGRGLGRGVQSGLRFLPERHTDFVLASYAEELGFLGITFLFMIYSVMFATIFRISSSLSHKEHKLYSFGILIILCTQFTINVGMNLGLLPITGITLPFMSYGGSSLVALSAGIGIVGSVWKQSQGRRLVEIKSFL